MYVSIENGGIARWDTNSNSVLELLQDPNTDRVHEMIISGDVLYIATRDNGICVGKLCTR